jgi:hypothetical protein
MSALLVIGALMLAITTALVVRDIRRARRASAELEARRSRDFLGRLQALGDELDELR